MTVGNTICMKDAYNTNLISIKCVKADRTYYNTLSSKRNRILPSQGKDNSSSLLRVIEKNLN